MLNCAGRIRLALAALVVWSGAACSDATGPRGDPLLTDSQLRSPEDPFAADVDTAYALWIQSHHNPVRSLTSDDFSDLQFLKPLLAGKRLVLLGESSHGVSEFSTGKARLIRFLHEQMGFDVLAFESGAWDCNYGDGVAGTGLDVLRQSIFGVWWVQEVQQLFDYVVATRGTSKRLTLAGFDIQASGGGISARPAALRTLLARVDTAYAGRAYRLDSAYVAGVMGVGGGKAWAAQNAGAATAYDSIARFLAEHTGAVLAGHAGDSTLLRVARMSVSGMRALIAELTTQDGQIMYEARDSAMARMVDFLADSVYRGHRIILWAHNYHVRNAGGEARPQSWLTMGTVLARHRRQEMYTIGFYMYRGEAADNIGASYGISAALPNSLEAILYRTRRKYAFLDLSRAGHTSGSAWIWQRTAAYDWGWQTWSFIPANQYDGIFFVDTTHPPMYFASTPGQISR